MVGSLVALAVLTLPGCGREGVTRYEVAKPPITKPRPASPHGGMGGPMAGPMGGAGMAGGGMGGGGGAKIQAPAYKVPKGWTEKPAGGMRLVSLSAGEGVNAIDASIVAFPGQAGGVTANFNRWRRQVGLPPLSEAELMKLIQPMTIDGAKGYIGVIAGTEESGGQAIVAVLIPHGGATWFFKMKGTGVAIKAHVEGFRSLLGSIHFAGHEGAKKPKTQAPSAQKPGAPKPGTPKPGAPAPAAQTPKPAPAEPDSEATEEVQP